MKVDTFVIRLATMAVAALWYCPAWTSPITRFGPLVSNTKPVGRGSGRKPTVGSAGGANGHVTVTVLLPLPSRGTYAPSVSQVAPLATNLNEWAPAVIVGEAVQVFG